MYCKIVILDIIKDDYIARRESIKRDLDRISDEIRLKGFPIIIYDKAYENKIFKEILDCFEAKQDFREANSTLYIFSDFNDLTPKMRQSDNIMYYVI